MGVVPARVHHTHVLAVEDGRHFGSERQRNPFRHGKPIHVRTERDDGTGPPAPEHSDHTGMGHLLRHFDTEGFEMGSHSLRGAKLSVGEFGVLVKVPSPLNDLGFNGVSHAIHLG